MEVCWCAHNSNAHLPVIEWTGEVGRPFCLFCWTEQRKPRQRRTDQGDIWPHHRFNEKPYVGRNLENWA